MSGSDENYLKILEIIHELDKEVDKMADKEWVGEKLDAQKELILKIMRDEFSDVKKTISDNQEDIKDILEEDGPISKINVKLNNSINDQKWAFRIGNVIWGIIAALIIAYFSMKMQGA